MSDIDPRLWRTDLTAPGPYGSPPWRWTLYIDGQLIADTDPALTDTEAQSWARHCLGEGVTFESVVDPDLLDPSERHDWVAAPTPPPGRLEHRQQEHPQIDDELEL